MPKKSTKSKPLTPKEVAHLKVEDQVVKMQQLMGFDLSTAYNLGINEGAQKVTQNHPEVKLGNVDALPELKKTKKKN